MESACLLESVPRNDVLFQHVFRYLSIRDLFQLRVVSQQINAIMDEYFSQRQHIFIKTNEGCLDDEAFKILTKNNTSIRTLVIPKFGEWVDDNLLVPIVNDCPNLSVLDLTDCQLLTNRTLCILGMYCDELTELSLKNCKWVDQDNFMVLVSNNRNLKVLDIENCVKLDDKCIDFMSTCCPDLESLSISEISELTDQSLDSIAKNCRKLKHLNIVSCWRMSDSGIGVVKEYCKHLETLNCEHCREISEDTLGALRFRGVSVDIQGRLEITLRRLEHVIDYLSPLVRQINHNL